VFCGLLVHGFRLDYAAPFTERQPSLFRVEEKRSVISVMQMFMCSILCVYSSIWSLQEKGRLRVILKARDWIEQKQLFRLTCDLGKIQAAYRLSVLDYRRWWGHGELF
jgi:hypothetical protein